ncbi:MAG: LysM peptidoglycan-binding domain-containing protein [Bacteroidetes bacterium]|nr:LysM peptidoglycan-binding domain-containing protein [Bacteroidota bacterium]
MSTLNNNIECPVCKASGIKKGSPRCPRCNSDLEVFGQIDTIEEGGSGSTAALMLAYFLVLVTIIAFVLFYFFAYKDAKAAADVNQTKMRQLTEQIDQLKTENDQYLQQIIDLRTRLGSGSDVSDVPVKPKKEESAQNQIQNSSSQRQAPVSQPKQIEQTKSQGGVVYHEVKPGESLRRISKKYFGDTEMYNKILKDNNIKTPDQIYPGQKLKIIR